MCLIFLTATDVSFLNLLCFIIFLAQTDTCSLCFVACSEGVCISLAVVTACVFIAKVGFPTAPGAWDARRGDDLNWCCSDLGLVLGSREERPGGVLPILSEPQNRAAVSKGFSGWFLHSSAVASRFPPALPSPPAPSTVLRRLRRCSSATRYGPATTRGGSAAEPRP